MFGIGHFPELLIVLVVALIVFGPGKLPEIGRSIGQGIRYFRQSTSELERTFSGAFDETMAPTPPPTTGMAAAPGAGAALEQPYTPPEVATHVAAEPTFAASSAPVVHDASTVPPAAPAGHTPVLEHAPIVEHTQASAEAHTIAATPESPAPVVETPPPPEAPQTAGIAAGAVAEFQTDRAAVDAPATDVAMASADTAQPRQRTRRVKKSVVPAASAGDAGLTPSTEGSVAVAEKPSAPAPGDGPAS